MNEFNPYTPPTADLSGFQETDSNGSELAERGTRLGASILDGLILMVPGILLIWLFFSSFGHKFWVPIPGLKGILFSLGAVIIGAIVDLAINGILLKKYGQTVGKKICNIKIIKTNGEVPSLFDSFIKRRVLFSLSQQVPFVGGLFTIIDILLIFRDSRRCLHDQIAGTVVVKA